MPPCNALAPSVTDDDAEGLYLPKQQPKKDTRSKLVRSKEAAGGMIVNACPFGCEDHELDDLQYCRHMVGTTDEADKRIFYPIKLREPSQPGVRPMRFTDGSDAKMVEKLDHLVRIHTCYRVYRENPEPPEVVHNPAKALRVASEAAVKAPDLDITELQALVRWAKANGYKAAAKTETPAQPPQPIAEDE